MGLQSSVITSNLTGTSSLTGLKRHKESLYLSVI